MAEAVYILCALTSITCATLLWSAYRKAYGRLLFWSALCFAGLAVNNILLFVDLVMVPAVDLSVVRSLIALASIGALIYGLLWESA